MEGDAFLATGAEQFHKARLQCSMDKHGIQGVANGYATRFSVGDDPRCERKIGILVDVGVAYASSRFNHGHAGFLTDGADESRTATRD